MYKSFFVEYLQKMVKNNKGLPKGYEDFDAVYKDPIPGVKIDPPMRPPRSGEIIIGYTISDGPKQCCKDSCCVWPDPNKMKVNAWFGVLAIALIFTPLMCVPCCFSKSYEMTQVPVYGPPPPSMEETK